MCEFAGGVLKIQKSKCCSSVLEYLKTGCDGTPDPAKVARVTLSDPFALLNHRFNQN